jgi:hypothetical protein
MTCSTTSGTRHPLLGRPGHDRGRAPGGARDRGWGLGSGAFRRRRERERACVAELALDLLGWPEGARAICRRERAHPARSCP